VGEFVLGHAHGVEVLVHGFFLLGETEVRSGCDVESIAYGSLTVVCLENNVSNNS
jgi:hypothetical protein